MIWLHSVRRLAKIVPTVERSAVRSVRPSRCSPVKSARSPMMRSRSEEHTSELQSLMRISYAVFCLKKKTLNNRIYVQLTNIQTHMIITIHTKQHQHNNHV